MKVALIRAEYRAAGHYDDYMHVATFVDSMEIPDEDYPEYKEAVDLLNSKDCNTQYELIIVVTEELPFLLSNLKQFRLEEKERLRKVKQEAETKKRKDEAKQKIQKQNNLINQIAKTLNITKEEAEKRINFKEENNANV